MAAPVRYQLFQSFRHFRSICALSRRKLHLSSQLDNKEVDDKSLDTITEGADSDLKDAIEAKRDVCRLPPRYEPWLQSRARPRERIHASDWKINNLRKEYARLGQASGLDPSIMWPTAEEIKNTVEFERQWEQPLQERWRIMKEEKDRLHSVKLERERKVRKNLAEMPRLLKQYNEKQKTKEAAQKAQEARKNKLMDDAREYFGYDIDPRDPKFLEMSAKREEEAKLLEKQRKKDEKAAKKTARTS